MALQTDNRPSAPIEVPRALLESLLEYAMRFAADNNEPSDGDCWRTIDAAEELRDAS